MALTVNLFQIPEGVKFLIRTFFGWKMFNGSCKIGLDQREATAAVKVLFSIC